MNKLKINSELLSVYFIIFIFILFKIPYIDSVFDGPHAQKYAAYVEPAVHMYENNNPLSNYHNYRYVPFSQYNNLGVRKFSHLPIIEWSLFILFKIFGIERIELITHIFMTFLGVLLILLMYSFISNYFSNIFSLSFISIVSSSMIFNLATKITILDTLCFIFMFLSLNSLKRGVKGNSKANFLIGLFFGFAIASKISLFLWYAPLLLILIFTISKISILEKLSNSLYIFLITLIIFIEFRLSVGILPLNAFKGIIFFLLFIFLNLFLYRYSDYICNKLIKYTDFILSKKVFLILFIASGLILSGLIINMLDLTSYSRGFLTDLDLVFNFRMYFEILYDLMNYITPLLTVTVLTGILLISTAFYKNYTGNKIIIAFIVGSIVYLLLASKVIFFHIYYNMIFLLTAALISAVVLETIFNNLQKKNIRTIAIICLLFGYIFILQENSYSYIQKGMNKDEFSHLVNYLKMNMKENEVWVGDAGLSTLVMFSNRARIGDTFNLDTKEFYKEKKKLGIVGSLKKEKIRFLLTKQDINNSWQDLKAILTSNEPLNYYSFRKEYINRQTNGNFHEPVSDINLDLKLVQTIGDVNIYDLYSLEYNND